MLHSVQGQAAAHRARRGRGTPGAAGAELFAQAADPHDDRALERGVGGETGGHAEGTGRAAADVDDGGTGRRQGQQGLDAEEGALEDDVAELVEDVPIVSEDAAGQDKSVSCGSGLTVGYQRACRGRTAYQIKILSFPSLM